MQSAEIEKLVSGMAEEILQGTDISLVDVEYVREKDWYLRIYIDKPGGIEIDDCQMVSEKLTEILDAHRVLTVRLKKTRILKVSTAKKWILNFLRLGKRTKK